MFLISRSKLLSEYKLFVKQLQFLLFCVFDVSEIVFYMIDCIYRYVWRDFLRVV